MNQHTKGPWEVGHALSNGQECIVGAGALAWIALFCGWLK